MKRFSPYIIKHINLHKDNILLDNNTGNVGNYLVFWWDQIPLGHLFLDSEDKTTEEDYIKRVVECIEPTINFYCAQHSPSIGHNLLQWFRNSEENQWKEFLAKLFTTRAKEIIPPQVPVSIVICTRNRPDSLNDCLAMLQRLECQPMEIVVVDNASDDDSTLHVVQQYPSVIYIKEPRPGLDIARNTGVTTANLPIVAFVDDDVVVHPLWLYQVYDAFKNPDVAAMTGLVIAAELETEAQWIFEKLWSFNRGYVDMHYNSNYIKKYLTKGPPVWEIGAGANMAFRKSVFDQVGLFDELLDVGAAGCSGDSEMWYRILINNYTINYNPRAVVYHSHRKEMAGLKKQIFSYMRGHTVAALRQQQHQQAGYHQHIFKTLPKYYMRLTFNFLKKNFPFYWSSTSMLWQEIKGMISGLFYFYRNCSNVRK